VAEHSRSFMQEIGAQISLAKSLVSRSGCLKFAKRFLIHPASKDISPVNVKMVRAAGWFYAVDVQSFLLAHVLSTARRFLSYVLSWA